MKLLSLFSIVAALTLSACSIDSPTSSPSDELAKRTHNVTWTLGGTLSSTTNVSGCDATNSIVSGTGYELAHLGLASGGGDMCMDYWHPIYGYAVTVPTPWGRYGSVGHATVTAANGDELHIVFTGEFAPPADWNGTMATLQVLEHTGTYTIESGTGRFDEASGSGTFAGVHTLSDNSYEMVLTGTLAY